MINENIKKARKTKKMSQEEMAVKLNVVRQTVSKWENGLSAPDADVLIKIADLLEVSVSSLLGVEIMNESDGNLADQLALINEELAEQKRKNSLAMQADKKRNYILFMSVFASIISIGVRNEVVSVVVVCVCLISALVILYRNLSLLTSVSILDFKAGAMRATTIFNIVLLLFVIGAFITEKMFGWSFMAMKNRTVEIGIIAAIMLFGGFVAPKLPFNRHTGLRLPWTVRDEDTWNLAHRIMGFISLPVVVLYLTTVCTISNFEVVSGIAVLLWVGLPGIVSGIYFLKKFGI